ncbi:MAG: arginine--tRNA ligase [Nanobdellota archaeon]
MMKTIKTTIAKELEKITSISRERILDVFETPKDTSHGDIALPCFIFAKQLQQNPVMIAKEFKKTLTESQNDNDVNINAIGPYLNIHISPSKTAKDIIPKLLDNSTLIEQESNPQTILVESPGPNTNKPLHLGHLRNMLLGSSITNILKRKGHDAKIVNVVNDRGIHICKSMLAYKKWGENKTPKNTGMKPDHFVGSFYVKFAQKASKSKENKKQLEKKACELLRLWESGDAETMKLWKQMNEWVYQGFETTYNTLNFKIEKNYYESETYTGGRDLVKEGLEKGVFEKDETGAIIYDLEDKKLGRKVLLRNDGTTVYITQDMNMARLRYEDFSFDSMIYVVANEQEYHFNVLFNIFEALNFPFANNCRHFSYGMVELPSGKMKSREGTVIDTDDLIQEMEELAQEEVKSRYDNLDTTEIKTRSKEIALSAIRFFFLKHDPLKNFVFDKQESLSFEGETGPYVQYTHARICSILKKSGMKANIKQFDLLKEQDEKRLILLLEKYNSTIEQARRQLKPSSLCHYLIKVCQAFNTYYAKHKIIQENKDLEQARINLISAVKKVIADGLEILDITALEEM